MTNALKYQGYTARIEFDAEDEVFVGRVLGIADRISFHGESVAELTEAFHVAVDHYLEDCRVTGREPLKPASGRVMLRIPPEVHAAANVAAQASGKSLNQWATDAIAQAAGETAHP
ncbi:type II toxin-antitoxin system HicB family antitoxin [Chromohalobacter sp. TMW 2.2308]|uniref:Type II toxin-antitoxin system HicB family antitoxin n=1 Tax=Chromohalobacter canadensis TaxID=141389 RepID=A0ABZ0YCY9_9GAMM|nr:MULTISPECIES: type II toxin-antitoxin system HicB family antitoxin [Chromohalobacter]MCK0768737.1 type II toxin-antitoxin system HicB family antitoxin [Chromohalobacter canadensis]MCK2043983.1 type II toxin-antitoxin system HicB family antitoxin [Chromohalobacter moromii]MCT8515892.1 type II toxin-antitoxin system HicB family antitoxin [Chromohalobacter sp. TMW 2.2271]WQH09236.1 type II toxin-antitoxin system HicB family antitoxin [Chromohalobacter canadensis]